MSKLTMGTAVLCLIVTAAVEAQGADAPAHPGQSVSNSVLSQLGLGGLQPLSDRQGLAVRGRAVHDGTPGSTSFITGPGHKALHGFVEHVQMKGGGYATTIVNHPRFGDVTVPPTFKK